jgi:hypothetical protein
VKIKLATLADQTDPQVIRRTLLEALDEVTEMAAGKVRTSTDGREYDDPDHSTVVRAIELAGRITGAIGVDPVVLIRFKNDTEKLVKQAQSVLRERESKRDIAALPTTGESSPVE